MPLNKEVLKQLSHKLSHAQSFILTTHKNCDADGLGSILAFHDLLKKQQKHVQSIVADSISLKYDFIGHKNKIKVHSPSTSIAPVDLAIVFDTNDSHLVGDLYFELTKKAKEIIFIDHHCPLETLSHPHIIYADPQAASTGEICFALIENLGWPISEEAARSLYMSVIFDTQMFRSTKNLAQAFYTCSQLFKYIPVNDIYENIFCQYDPKLWNQIIQTLQHVKYDSSNQIAYIELNHKDFKKSQLNVFHLLDCLDFVMKRKDILISFLSAEIKPQVFKLSFRSKTSMDVSALAESLGGGGHAQSSGATVRQYSSKDIIQKIESLLSQKVA